MKTKQEHTQLIQGGKERFENTNEFKRKAEEIKGKVRDKYALTFLDEKSWTKRVLIFIKREIEILRRISKLSSLKNLHMTHP